VHCSDDEDVPDDHHDIDDAEDDEASDEPGTSPIDTLPQLGARRGVHRGGAQLMAGVRVGVGGGVLLPGGC